MKTYRLELDIMETAEKILYTSIEEYMQDEVLELSRQKYGRIPVGPIFTFSRSEDNFIMDVEFSEPLG